MNKICKIYLSLLLPAVLSASCRQDDTTGMVLPLEVTAEIGTSHTRAEDPHASDYDKKKFDTGDLITIKRGSEGSGFSYERSATGTWKPASPAYLMTTKGGETFTATFPDGFSEIKADQSTPSGFFQSNRLSATAKATDNYVRFTFAPAACKITIIVSYQSDDTAQGATVAGMGLRSGNKSSSESIILLKTSETTRRHTYAGIFSPAAAKSYTISVAADNSGTQTYTEKGDGLTFEAGYNYQYTFTSTNELILTSVVVTDFADGGTEDAGSAT